MKLCVICGGAGPFLPGRRQCNACYRAQQNARRPEGVAIESTALSSAEIGQLIVANANEQQAMLDDILPDKAARLAALRREQWRLYAQRDAARRDERGLAPREHVGVRREGR